MILVWNTGSSSIKYSIYDKDLNVLSEKTYSNLKSDDAEIFKETIALAISEIKKQSFVLSKIALRIVSAGEHARQGQLIDSELITKIEQFSRIILHNKIVLEVIKASVVAFPGVYHLAYFDTAYFQNLPREAKTYALPKFKLDNTEVVRFGYHGISHQFAFESSACRSQKVISLHLGAGSSAAAILNGKPIDISMGYSTCEGLIMQTRSGDIDPLLVLELADEVGIKKAHDILQNQSGLLALSGQSGEMLDILYTAGHPVEDESYLPKNIKRGKDSSLRAKFALSMYVMKIRKYIGSYAALMNGVDCIIFTGKIGAGSKFIRDQILSDMDYLGEIEVKVVKPDEELAIARLVRNHNLR